MLQISTHVASIFTCCNYIHMLQLSTHVAINYTCCRELVPHVRATEFRKNVDYSFYVLGSNFIFMSRENDKLTSLEP